MVHYVNNDIALQLAAAAALQSDAPLLLDSVCKGKFAMSIPVTQEGTNLLSLDHVASP